MPTLPRVTVGDASDELPGVAPPAKSQVQLSGVPPVFVALKVILDPASPLSGETAVNSGGASMTVSVKECVSLPDALVAITEQL